MRSSVLLICINSMQPVFLGRKSMLSVVLSHGIEKALFQTHCKAQTPRGQLHNCFNITPQTPQVYPGYPCGVYGSRYMSGRHEKISRDNHCPTPRPQSAMLSEGRWRVGMRPSRWQALAPVPRGPLRIQSKDALATRWRKTCQHR